MSTEVREILDRIQRLSEAQLLELRRELAWREEDEWAKLASAARQTARQRGLDDQAIARAVEAGRYGNDSGAE